MISCIHQIPPRIATHESGLFLKKKTTAWWTLTCAWHHRLDGGKASAGSQAGKTFSSFSRHAADPGSEFLINMVMISSGLPHGDLILLRTLKPHFLLPHRLAADIVQSLGILATCHVGNLVAAVDIFLWQSVQQLTFWTILLTFPYF